MKNLEIVFRLIKANTPSGEQVRLAACTLDKNTGSISVCPNVSVFKIIALKNPPVSLNPITPEEHIRRFKEKIIEALEEPIIPVSFNIYKNGQPFGFSVAGRKLGNKTATDPAEVIKPISIKEHEGR